MSDPKKKATLMSDEISNQRDKIFERSKAAQEGGAPPEEPSAEPTPAAKTDFTPAAPAEPGATTPTPPATPPATPAAEPAAKPSEPAPVSGDKKDERTVPLSALHESRAELKKSKQQVEDLQKQVDILLNDIKEMREEKPSSDDSDVTVTDYDKVIADLRKEISDLKKRNETQDMTEQQKRAQEAQVTLEATIARVDSELAAEGYSGFKDLTPMVEAELQRLVREDEVYAKTVNNPAGWKKLFKETIFPRISGVTGKKAHGDKIAAKEELKTGASLPLSGDVPPAAPKADDKKPTFDDYIKDREARSAQPQTRRG